MVIAGRYNRGPELPLDELTPWVRGYGQRVMIYIDENGFGSLF